GLGGVGLGGGGGSCGGGGGNVGRGRLDAFGAEGVVDFAEEEVERDGAVDLVAVDEEGGRGVDVEGLANLLGGFDGRGVLFGEAGLELRHVGLLELALFFGQVIELLGGAGEGLVGLGVLGVGADVGGVGVNVVDEVPVAGGGLGGEAVDVDGGAHGPGVLVEREVFVDDADVVAVAPGEGGEDAFVEAGAEGALEVIEADDDDGRGGRAAAGGAAVGGDHGAGIGGEVEFGELGEGFAVL